jgi:hypothetical protein
MVTVLTPPSTVDAISGDDMDTSDSLESGIEGSIKRCEALLSMLPMTLGKPSDSDGTGLAKTPPRYRTTFYFHNRTVMVNAKRLQIS